VKKKPLSPKSTTFQLGENRQVLCVTLLMKHQQAERLTRPLVLLERIGGSDSRSGDAPTRQQRPALVSTTAQTAGGNGSQESILNLRRRRQTANM